MRKVSVIIPVYNTEKYLSRCMESLLGQTLSDIEIICINDGSSDDSKQILDSFSLKDSRIICINQENKGQAVARNLGLSIAEGKYIMFCDSDDWYNVDMCEKMFNAIEKEKVDLVNCRTNVHIEEGHFRPKENLEYKQLMLLDRHKLNDFNKKQIKVLIWDKIFKKEIIGKYRIRFPENVPRNEDDCFIFQYLSVAKDFYGLDAYLYNFLARENSLMDIFYKDQTNGIERFHILEYYVDFLLKNDLLFSNWDFCIYMINKQFRICHFHSCKLGQVESCFEYYKNLIAKIKNYIQANSKNSLQVYNLDEEAIFKLND